MSSKIYNVSMSLLHSAVSSLNIGSAYNAVIPISNYKTLVGLISVQSSTNRIELQWSPDSAQMIKVSTAWVCSATGINSAIPINIDVLMPFVKLNISNIVSNTNLNIYMYGKPI